MSFVSLCIVYYRTVDSWLWVKWSQLQWWNMQTLKLRHGSRSYRGTQIWIIRLQVGRMVQEVGRSTSAVCQAGSICHFLGNSFIFYFFSILCQKTVGYLRWPKMIHSMLFEKLVGNFGEQLDDGVRITLSSWVMTHASAKNPWFKCAESMCTSNCLCHFMLHWMQHRRSDAKWCHCRHV